MKKHRLRELLVAAPGRGLWVAGICLLTLALHACQKPSFGTSDGPAAVEEDAHPVSWGDAHGSSGPDAVDSAVPQVCQAGGEAPSKGKGEACACDYECRTGHCANGVCCMAACSDRCMACNLPSSLGDCSFVPAGVSPADPAHCQASDPASCGQDGKCDGKGGCQLHLAETVCSQGTCQGDGLGGVKVCDGKGNCSGDRSLPCAPYSCNTAIDECHSACDSDVQCAVGQKCVSDSCGVKLNGYKCKQDSECASGHCSGGICCNRACNDPCVSCALAGSYGRCRLVPAGQPDPQCEKRAETTCGTTGLCDGTGACALWPANTTPCRSATCSGSVLLTTTAVCDGRGTCKTPTLVDCSPYLCVSGQCNRNCKSDGDCQPGHACILGPGGVGTCSGKQQLGQPCQNPESCDSGNCVDGVCCESSCEGACRSCALPGSPGRCTDLPADARDPRAICVDEGAASCGRTGLCDGVGGCQLYPADITRCGPPSCDDQNIFTDASTCNQAGQCVPSSSRDCYPYVCSGSACLRSCSKESDCVPPNTCTDGWCGKAGIGAECSSAVECQSGFCAQGVCCNSACDGTCKACNVSGSQGLCTTVADGSPDPQGKCVPTASSTCGTTGTCKGGACAFFDTATPCGAASCASSSSLNPTPTCDGHGACVAPGEASCGNFLCVNNACLETCRIDADCVSPNICVQSSCGLRQKGAACTKAEQCGSGFCTEGVCCDSACADGTSNGLCMSCKVSGKVGTCSAVPDGQADPKQRCVASNPALGDCSSDGTCNGKGGCRPWPKTVGCRAASCSGSQYTPASNCDGDGHCPFPTIQWCNPYKCGSGASCLTTCTTDADCVQGESCLASHRCGDKLANGQPCGANADCLSNICSGEGVCCDSLCSGGCESCILPSHVGACTNITAGNLARSPSTCPVGQTCGNTGLCDGRGGCQLAAEGKLCGADTCATPLTGQAIDGSNVSESVAVIPASRCDGRGACQARAPVSCDGYQCAAGKCKTAPCSDTKADCNALIPSADNPKGGNSCVPSLTGNTCKKLALGASCGVGQACENGHCVDGTCCEAATCDDHLSCTTDSCANTGGTCSHTLAPGSCLIDNVCYEAGATLPTSCRICDPARSTTGWSPITAGTTCRPKVGECDAVETCDGVKTDCPADAFLPHDPNSPCRPAAGPCDSPELCNGSGAACPPDTFLPHDPNSPCRPAAGPCDLPELCTGSGAACPQDTFLTDPNNPCRPGAGACDSPEFCNGGGAACPPDLFLTDPNNPCRPAAGPCDSPELCNGSGAACPPDTFLTDPNNPCRPAAGPCDSPELCNGSGAACPQDLFRALGEPCQDALNPCVEGGQCSGLSPNCICLTTIQP